MKPDDIKQRLDSLFAQSPFAGISQEVQQVLQARLQAMLSSMNLVSREEFDVQTEVLMRTQAMLRDMEARLEELERSSAADAE